MHFVFSGVWWFVTSIFGSMFELSFRCIYTVVTSRCRQHVAFRGLWNWIIPRRNWWIRQAPFLLLFWRCHSLVLAMYPSHTERFDQIFCNFHPISFCKWLFFLLAYKDVFHVEGIQHKSSNIFRWAISENTMMSCTSKCTFCSLINYILNPLTPAVQ